MSFVRTLAAVAAVAVLSLNSASAGFIVGNQVFSQSNISVVHGVTTLLTNVTTNTSSGAFNVIPVGTSIGNISFSSTASSLVLSNTAFGTFTATGVSSSTVGITTTYVFTGSFAPGTLFTGGTATPGTYTAVIVAIPVGAGNTIYAGSSYLTTVPEPSSLGLACVGGLMGLVAVRRNRK